MQLAGQGTSLKARPVQPKHGITSPQRPASTQGGSRGLGSLLGGSLLGFAGSVTATGRRAQGTATSTEVNLQPVEKVKNLIKENEVIMFSKTTCPFCSQAKDVLKSTGSKFVVVELDELPAEEGAAMQDAFAEMTGARTVPRIFVRGACVGGCDDLLALQQDGSLQQALQSKSFQIKVSEEEWRKKLDPRSYRILRQQGTEPPGSHAYDRFMPTKGYFACGACALPLYSADSKFRSSCGWPVFKTCYYSKEAGGCHVGTVSEFGGLEIVCNRCGSHLGHVFFDSFKPDNPNGERH